MSAVVAKETLARIADRAEYSRAEREHEDKLSRGAGLDASLVALARELAQDIETADVVLQRHGYTGGAADPAWAEIQSRPEFHRLLASQILEWSAADSTKKRIALKAQVALEASLPGVFAIGQNPNSREQDRLKAAELLARFGGVGPDGGAAGGAGGMTFSLKLVLASGQTVRVIDQNGVSEGVQPREVVEAVFSAPLVAPSFLVGEGRPIEGDEDDE
jgi:hypothetical protein